MPRVHRVAALLDRWWLGIHHGAIDADHLDYYLDEFTFRFNRRRSQARGLLFFRLLQQAVQHEPVPYRAAARFLRVIENERWILEQFLVYFREIQDAGEFENWKGPPYDHFATKYPQLSN